MWQQYYFAGIFSSAKSQTNEIHRFECDVNRWDMFFLSQMLWIYSVHSFASTLNKACTFFHGFRLCILKCMYLLVKLTAFVVTIDIINRNNKQRRCNIVCIPLNISFYYAMMGISWNLATTTQSKRLKSWKSIGMLLYKYFLLLLHWNSSGLA